jgi:hypothetical protein
MCFTIQPSCVLVYFYFCFTFSLCHFHFILFYIGLLLPSSYPSSVSSSKHLSYIIFIAFYLTYFTLSSYFIFMHFITNPFRQLLPTFFIPCYICPLYLSFLQHNCHFPVPQSPTCSHTSLVLILLYTSETFFSHARILLINLWWRQYVAPKLWYQITRHHMEEDNDLQSPPWARQISYIKIYIYSFI